MKCIHTFSFDTFISSKLLFICLWLKKMASRVEVLVVKILFLVEAGECDDGVWKDT